MVAWLISLGLAANLVAWFAVMLALDARLLRNFGGRVLYFMVGVFLWIQIALLLLVLSAAAVCLTALGTRGYAAQALVLSLIVLVACMMLLVRGGRRNAEGQPTTSAARWPILRLALVAGALTVLSVSVVTLADRHLQAKLGQWQQQINAEYAELTGSRPANDQNAALRYRQIFAELDRALDAFDRRLDQRAPATEPSDQPEVSTDLLGNTNLPESLRVAIAEATRKSRAERLLEKRDLTQAPVREFALELASLAEQLGQAAELDRCHFGDGSIPSLAQKMPELKQFHRAGQAMCLVAQWQAAHGATADALKMVRSMHRMADHMKQDQVVLARCLLADQIHMLANEALAAALESAPSVDQLPGVLPVYVPAEQDIRRAFDGERLYVSRISVDLAGDDPSLMPRRVPGLAMIYRLLWMQSDRALYDAVFRQGSDGVSGKTAASTASGSILAKIAVSPVGDIRAASLESTAMARQLPVVRELVRYRIEHKAYPESLGELGIDIPVDPFDGQPMRYRRVGTGPVIYSVGRDRADSGGQTGNADTPAADVGFRLQLPDHVQGPGNAE